MNTLIHHCEAVLHLRFYNGMMVTCSKDRSIAVWDMVSNNNNKLCKVPRTVLLLGFVWCFFQCWCIGGQVSNVSLQVSPTEINLRRVLVGHRAAVNVVDFDEKYIVSASGDRTIKVWNTR